MIHCGAASTEQLYYGEYLKLLHTLSPQPKEFCVASPSKDVAQNPKPRRAIQKSS